MATTPAVLATDATVDATVDARVDATVDADSVADDAVRWHRHDGTPIGLHPRTPTSPRSAA